MATDNSPPKIRVILTIAFSSVVILTALSFVFRSYYQMMVDEVEMARLRPQEQLLQLREGEKKNLTSGAMPIDNAIKTLAQRGRSGSFKDIEPEQSTDLGAMVGWGKAPNAAMAARAEREAAKGNEPAPAEAPAPATSSSAAPAPSAAPSVTPPHAPKQRTGVPGHPQNVPHH